jgi:hypothetical protein
VAGWGRIQTVRRLAGTQDPQIKAWLLRHGFRNQIMDEYLARAVSPVQRHQRGTVIDSHVFMMATDAGTRDTVGPASG